MRNRLTEGSFSACARSLDSRVGRRRYLACRAALSWRDYANWGVMTQSSTALIRRAFAAGLVGGLSLALAGCGVSSITSGLGGGMFGGGNSTTVADTSGAVSEEQLLSAAKAEGSAPGATVTGGINPGCPRLTARPSESNITFYEPGRTGDGLAIMHRGEITKTARECRVEAGRVTVKYGFSGRVLLGPRGQSGTVSLPINVIVTDGANAKVAADAVKLDVAVALDKPIGYFSAVREVSFPVAEGARPGEYELFVSFDRAKAPGAG